MHRIHSIQGNNYTVNTEQGMVVCRARGLFRKQGITPLVGDFCDIELHSGGEIEGYITAIAPRQNELRRPPVANLDQLFLLCSMRQPRPNLPLLDTLIATAEIASIAPVIVFTKGDLDDTQPFVQIYANCGYPTFSVDPDTDVRDIAALLAGKTSAFCGNTGVGKSTLLNRIAPQLQLATGEVSQKLGRGRHTTRHVQLFPAAGGWVADTPGFAFFEALELDKDNVAQGFVEFADYADQCRFHDCAHVKDSGCAVLAAVAAGEIAQSRHESYVALYNELKDKRDWEK
ncbi:MAG: ribosome small subunit-dependent GTPase A [Oscillospiraceae bacterium]|nr:ribosome small subunit-dependent GTPase A [Oscillospiraceae bacterium]